MIRAEIIKKVDNTYHPEELFLGGGSIGLYKETSWTGTDVSETAK